MDAFEISGRGLVVVLDGGVGLPVGTSLPAVVVRPDGTTIEAEAFKEWLLKYRGSVDEREAFLLRGLAKADVPIGSEIEFGIAE